MRKDPFKDYVPGQCSCDICKTPMPEPVRLSVEEAQRRHDEWRKKWSGFQESEYGRNKQIKQMSGIRG